MYKDKRQFWSYSCHRVLTHCELLLTGCCLHFDMKEWLCLKRLWKTTWKLHGWIGTIIFGQLLCVCILSWVPRVACDLFERENFERDNYPGKNFVLGLLNNTRLCGKMRTCFGLYACGCYTFGIQVVDLEFSGWIDGDFELACQWAWWVVKDVVIVAIFSVENLHAHFIYYVAECIFNYKCC